MVFSVFRYCKKCTVVSRGSMVKNKKQSMGYSALVVKGLRKGYKILTGSFCKMGSLVIDKLESVFGIN